MWLLIAKDNLKACIPFKQSLRSVLRKISPYESLKINDELAFEQGLQLVRFMQEYEVRLDTALEVGTGWIPTIPNVLKACGARKIILTDIEPLSDSQTTNYARHLVEGSLQAIEDLVGTDSSVLKENLIRPNIEEYRCPPRLDELGSNSVDLVYSRTVLEHISEPELTKLLIEWRRLLTPGGFCIHFIDNSDHLEHRDKSLSRINFLKFSEHAWKFACFNPQNYQNRLRHSDYVRMFANAGFELLHVEGEPNSGALADLRHLVLDRRFETYAHEDLAILTSIIVARKPVSRETTG